MRWITGIGLGWLMGHGVWAVADACACSCAAFAVESTSLVLTKLTLIEGDAGGQSTEWERWQPDVQLEGPSAPGTDLTLELFQELDDEEVQRTELVLTRLDADTGDTGGMP